MTEAVDFIRSGLVIIGEVNNGCELGEYLAGISSDVRQDEEGRNVRRCIFRSDFVKRTSETVLSSHVSSVFVIQST